MVSISPAHRQQTFVACLLSVFASKLEFACGLVFGPSLVVISVELSRPSFDVSFISILVNDGSHALFRRVAVIYRVAYNCALCLQLDLLE